MNDEDIEKIASRVAELLYQKAQENVDNDSFKIPKEEVIRKLSNHLRSQYYSVRK